MNTSLAIVIPAYKPDFLAQALESIASQTNKNFSLYIGDDCSPYDLFSIVSKYADSINLSYTRFDVNIGGQNLVAQWERCIALSKDEEYIWLFSDDDVMEPSCVENLYLEIENTKSFYDLYHFDINVIDENGILIKRPAEYPSVLNDLDYYVGKIRGNFQSYVVENIFSRKIYESVGGFVNFDLAWGSDTATWTLFCGEKGMCKVPGSRVNWRKSSLNISPNVSEAICERKVKAVCSFLEWSYSYFQNKKIDIFDENRKMLINRLRGFKKYVSKKCIGEAVDLFFKSHGHYSYKVITSIIIKFPF